MATPRSKGRGAALAAIAAAVTLAACSASPSASRSNPATHGRSVRTTTSTTQGTTTSTAGAIPDQVVIDRRVIPAFGAVLVDAGGRTLYSLSSERGGVATCVGACATAWPPVVLRAGTLSATAGAGVDPRKLSTAEAPDGTVYESYAGWPLYTYGGDHAPGAHRGAGVKSFGGTWEPVRTSGALAARP